MASAWVIKEKESGQFWTGFGFTRHLHEARFYGGPQSVEDTEMLGYNFECLEVRTIYRESDKKG